MPEGEAEVQMDVDASVAQEVVDAGADLAGSVCLLQLCCCGVAFDFVHAMFVSLVVWIHTQSTHHISLYFVQSIPACTSS